MLGNTSVCVTILAFLIMRNWAIETKLRDGNLLHWDF